MNDAFAVLGVGPTASTAQVRAAYRKRARQLDPYQHVQPDGTVPEGVHESFHELNQAFRQALAALSPAPTAATEHPVFPEQHSRIVPAIDDPVTGLRVLPFRAGSNWSAEAMEVWERVLIGTAEHLVEEAHRMALASGATPTERTAAAAHALLTLSLREVPGPVMMGVVDLLSAAYATLEENLQPVVLERLPTRPLL